MLRPRHQYRILTAAFLFALIGVAFFAGYAGLRLQASLVDHPTNQPTQASSSNQQQREGPWERWTDPLAVFTALLAFGTFLMARGVYRQVALGREEFLASHRPEIAILAVEAGDPYKLYGPADTLVASLRCVNRGASDAIGVEIHGEILKMSGLPAPDIMRRLRQTIGVLKVGIKAIETFDSEVPLVQMAAFGNQSIRFYFVGTISYHDRLNSNRKETGFCYVYEVYNRKWEKVQSEAYNYAF